MTDITRSEILACIRAHRLGVQASVSAVTAPQAAVVGFAITDEFEIVFDAIETTRKIVNLRRNRACALVIGGLTAGDERTIQYEGLADEPSGGELARVKESYFAVFPDGREREKWPGITYVRLRPRWLRYSDYNQSPPAVVELAF